jgi:hypothetical protein
MQPLEKYFFNLYKVLQVMNISLSLNYSYGSPDYEFINIKLFEAVNT